MKKPARSKDRTSRPPRPVAAPTLPRVHGGALAADDGAAIEVAPDDYTGRQHNETLARDR